MQCPLCKREFDPKLSEAMPFCSARCREIDLGRWLNEEYSLPRVPDPDAEETSKDNDGDEGRSPQANGAG